MIPRNKIDRDKHACSLSKDGGWYVPNLIEFSKNKANIIEFELDTYSIALNETIWGNLTMYDIINHFRQTNEADLQYPVILSEEGWILDGWHRIVKAILNEQRYIKAVRFKKNPDFDTFTVNSSDNN